MNYRELQLRQQNKNTIAKLKTEWDLERNILQQDIINLENSADIQVLKQEQEKSKKLQKLLDDTISLLGSEDIKNLTDLKNLLQGKTLKELITNHQKELKESKKQVQTLTKANDKLSKEKDALVLENEKLKREIEFPPLSKSK